MRYLRLFEQFSQDGINSVDDLISMLRKFSIPIDSWGTGSAKNVENLFDEIQNDECVIVDRGGYLVRHIEFVGVRILFKDKDGQTWVLTEDRQEFKDGRVRRRNMPSSVSEKMKFGEDPMLSAVRGIREELGVEISQDQLRKHRPIYYDGGSQSYPGLKAKYKGHQFTCYFDETQFKKGGYVEIQKDKSTFFIWVKR